MSYVELHCHSAYSFLDGASLPEELVATAAKLGYDTLALTDHNGVFGSMEHEQAARSLGVRAIHGAELDVTDPAGDKHGTGTRHLTLLVQDARGWRNLCHLLTRAHKHTRAPDGGRVILAPSVPVTDLLERAEGLVCLSGCARQGVRDEPSTRRLLDAFGPDRFRVELQRPFLRHDRALNRGLSALARRLGVPCVATGNVHAHSRERGRLQDAFVAIREHATLDASEPLRRGNQTHVLASPRAMAARFADHPDAVAETARLAERLRFDLGADLGYRYPGADDADADRELAERCWAAFGARYPVGHKLRGDAHARLEEELRVIRSLGLSGFFVLHADLLELAREVAVEVRGPSTARGMLPPGRGRGSSVSSIVCYLTGLSHVDPVENDLFLGRFLNEELTALPDIDLDFPRDVREVLIPRVHERYGSDRAALVAAFPTYRSRGAIREIGRALGLPPGEIERVAKVAEPWAQSVEEDVELALGAAAEAAEGTGSNRAASGGQPGFDTTSPAATSSGAVVSGSDATHAVGTGGAGPDTARAAARAASAAANGSRPEASPPAADFVGASGVGTRPKPSRWDPPDDGGPSPPGPPPWTPEAGRRALQEGQARRAESRSTPAQMGAVARTRFGGPDTSMQPVSFGDDGGFHDAYGDTQARAARTARTAINHGDKGWEPPTGDGSGRSLAGTGGQRVGAAGGPGAAGAAGAAGGSGAAGAAGGARPGSGAAGAPTGAGAQAAGASGALQGRWGWLAGLAQEAYGLPRHLSQHPGGMIVSTRPLIDCVPLVPAAMAGRQMCHWDKDSCADAGFLKIDLLGLGMLSAVERCVEEIARVRAERIDLSRIPFDDKATYAAIQSADTMGVFQIESRAQMQSLLRTRPENLDDLTIQVAIVRPGPIVGGAVNPYIDRKQKLRANPDFEIPYDHPSLEPVLKDTLGTIIFQDQVIEVAQAFAGFSPGEAEGLRRAMSRKRSAAAMEAHHERFVEGAAQTHGADRETAERVFQMVAGFSGFGFPKAHGAAFGLLAYQSTWLRVHYKPEFTAALLNEQPMGFYPSDTLVHEAQRTGIDVRAPDVNASRVLCHVEDPGTPVPAAGRPGGGAAVPGGGATVPGGGAAVPGGGATVPGWWPGRAAVRIGLGYLNGARAVEVATIVAEREANGPFRSLGDLASRSGVSRQALSVLAWSGACDGLIGARTESARRTALWRLGMAAPAAKAGDGSQLALPLELPDAPPLAPLQAWERMVADYATTGLTAGPHPMALARDVLPADVASAADLTRLHHGARLRIGGLVVARQRPATANGIVFMLLEDEHGTINLVVPPETYDRDRLVVRGEPLVFAEGRLEKHPKAAGAINIVVDRLRPLDLGPADNGVAEVVALSVAARADGSGGHDELADADPVEPWMPAVAAAGGGGGGGGGGPGPTGASSAGGRGGRGGGPGDGGPGGGGRGGGSGGGGSGGSGSGGGGPGGNDPGGPGGRQRGRGGGEVRDFAAVAPPVQSFGQGRR